MKEKFLTLIIGILIGAILTTGGFLIYNKVNLKNKAIFRGDRPQMMQNGSDMKMPPNMQNESNQDNGKNMGTPPEKPSGDGQSSQSTSPEKNSQTNNNNSNNS